MPEPITRSSHSMRLRTLRREPRRHNALVAARQTPTKCSRACMLLLARPPHALRMHVAPGRLSRPRRPAFRGIARARQLLLEARMAPERADPPDPFFLVGRTLGAKYRVEA